MGNAVLIVKDMIFIHVLMDNQTCFPVKTLELTTFGLHKAQLRGEPRSRLSERDRSGFKGSKRVENVV